MPRKVRPPADQVRDRNRENQQRSRARRREYVQSLEDRLRACEAAGTRATLEMQMAAREVVWTNDRLMDLLALKGVAKGEIEEYLRGCKNSRREGDGEELTTATHQSMNTNSAYMGIQLTTTTPATQRKSQKHSNGKAFKQQDNHDNDDQRSTSPSSPALASTATMTRPVSRNETGTSSPQPPPPTTVFTSCDDAADIIASFQGHGDVLRVRTALLGCGEAKECHVKNTTLFQLME
ncbi:hypothetical protein F5Y17DRAFT_9011 [Xylariaceae sp. FL0594]|nr:hypothetical protein F5Y17DRAFT_9011 [Xylariaceae sp. FL0594]